MERKNNKLFTCSNGFFSKLFPTLVRVSWTVQQKSPNSEDADDETDDVMHAPTIEPYSDFVIQMKHYTTFLEDWHNLSRIENKQEGPQSYNVALSEFETGYGEYRILGMTKSGRSITSELSEGLRIDLKTSPDHFSDHDHEVPEQTKIDRREDIPPVITRAAALSDHSILLEWTVRFLIFFSNQVIQEFLNSNLNAITLNYSL